MLLTIVRCVIGLTIANLCLPTDASGIYWSEFMANITEPVRGAFEHQVNMYLFLHAAEDPTWFIGPPLRCDCFLSGQVRQSIKSIRKLLNMVVG